MQVGFMMRLRATGDVVPITELVKQVMDLTAASGVQVQYDDFSMTPQANPREPFDRTNGKGDLPLDKLELEMRAYNCLKRVGINTYADLCDKTIFGLRSIPNVGTDTMYEILEAMSREGILLKPKEG